MTTEPVVVAARAAEETSPVRLTGAHPVATGPLLGGNLCLLAASVGTPDQPDLRGAVLLLEEVGRAAVQGGPDAAPPAPQRRAGGRRRGGRRPVHRVRRRVDNHHCGRSAEHLGALGVPVLGGLPIGHGRDQLTVPLGVPATLDVDAGTLTVAPAVTA